MLGDPVVDSNRRILKVKESRVAAIDGVDAAAYDLELDANSDEKSLLAFQGTFNKDSIPVTAFEDDFAEVVRQHNQEKLLRKQKKAEKLKFADVSAMRVYQRLVEVCSDGAALKRRTRIAFKKWVEVIQQEKQVDDDDAPFDDPTDVPGEETHLVHLDSISEIPKPRDKRLKRQTSSNKLSDMSIKDKKKLMVELLHGKTELDRVVNNLTGQMDTAEESLHERILRTTTHLQTFSDADVCADYLDDYLLRLHSESIGDTDRTRNLFRQKIGTTS